MARPRLSLGARIFLITATLVALAVGSAVAVTYFFGNQVAQRTAREALERAGSVQAALQRQRVEQLGLMARVFSGDPALTAYVSEAAELGDNVSVLDLLEERQNDLGFDFAIVLDPEGRVVARTDDPNATGADLSGRSLVRKALEELEAVGFWEQDGRLFNAVAVPLAADRLLVGFLIAGFAIDDVAALDIRRVSDAEVAFLVNAGGQPRIAASTLEPALGEELLAQLEQRADGRAGDGTGAVDGAGGSRAARPPLDRAAQAARRRRRARRWARSPRSPRSTAISRPSGASRRSSSRWARRRSCSPRCSRSCSRGG